MAKKPLKKLLSSAPVQWVLAFIIAAYALLAWFTARVRVQNQHFAEDFWRKNEPVIVALWHGRLLLMPFLFPRKLPVSALISSHRDGQLIRRAAWFYGIHTISGSSTRGGMAALREMLRRAQGGQTLFITPDGPKGPRMTLSKGTVELARMSKLPVVPVSIAVKEGKFVKSWDRFLLPGLFSTVLIRWEKPVTLAKNAGKKAREDFRQALEKNMVSLQQVTDSTLGWQAPVQPEGQEKPA